MEHNVKESWDVIVVGGGPAGMMAAATAAQRGLRVVLLEKNDTLGKKLLITGGGRCNVTNSEFDTRKFLSKFKQADKFLFSAFSQHNVEDSLNFFHAHGMDTKVENDLRTFPVSDSAQSVWDVLVGDLKKHNVTVQSHSPVVKIVMDTESESKSGDKKIVGVELKNKKVIFGNSLIIATGGTSRPETGSTGDAYAWLRELGHTVTEPAPSLVPVAVKDVWVKKLAGVSLPEVKITLLQNGQKQNVSKGKILFTHVGVSGPGILNMSRDVSELLKYGDVDISLDLLLTLDHSMLNSRLQDIFREHDKKKIQNSLSSLVPTALVPVVIELAGIDPDTACNSITREERLRLIDTLKHIPLHVSHLLGTDKAIITSGGVGLDKVDFKTMRSRLYDNLYLVGDILDIDRPSGGYSLQLCWTTGYVAGSHVEM